MSCFAFLITPYSLLINTGFLRFARNDQRDAEINKRQNNTATSNALICQHDLTQTVVNRYIAHLIAFWNEVKFAFVS